LNLYQIITIITGGIIALFFLLFTITSVRERQLRAACLSLGGFVFISILLVGGVLFWQPSDTILITISASIWIFGLLYFLPTKKPASIDIGTIAERVDERDTMFAREEYHPGTDKYEKYYSRHLSFKEADDRLRQLPEFLEPGGHYYKPDQAQKIKALFRATQALTSQVDGPVDDNPDGKDPVAATAMIKNIVGRMGADEVGIAHLNRMFVYSHVGRGPEQWGEPITLNHRYAIAFTMEMNHGMVQKAPDLPITEETAFQYLRAATISVNLARFIRNLGYPARAHISESNYQIMLPPVAHDAGLGELSRMGYLISRKFGARVRLGAVTTDLPLVTDRPVAFGVQDFCAVCLKCVRCCPSAAIPGGDKTNVRGVKKWQLDIEKCMWFWRIAGSDCGLCMKVCPYSHPPTIIHDLVRAGIRHSAFARRVSVWGDDILYGRKDRAAAQ
jgi:ferredoxin